MARDDAEAELTPEEFVGSFRQYGDAVALRTPAGAMTYKELADQVGKARRLLANSSPSSVPRAALTATQDPGALAIFLAAQLQGMALLLLDPRQRPSERSRSALNFGSGKVIESGDIIPQRDLPRPVPIALGPAIGLQTSGVQGEARLVQRYWSSVIDNARLWRDALCLTPGERVLCTTNWHHSYGLGSLLASLLGGACYILPRSPASPEAVRNVTQGLTFEVLLSVPVLYDWYTDTILPGIIRPRLCISAGEALPGDTARAWSAVGCHIREHYGSSELGMVTIDPRGVPGSVGIPLPGTRAELAAKLRERGHLAKAEQTGSPDELCIAPSGEGPMLFDADGTVRSGIDSKGWFFTGDLAEIDDNDNIFLRGRIGNVINVGTNKVRADDVERVIREFGQIRDVVVVGRQTSPREQVWAYVTGPDKIDTASLRRHLSQRLRPLQVPTVIRQVQELPRTASGKIRRSVVRKWAVQGSDRSVRPEPGSGVE